MMRELYQKVEGMATSDFKSKLMDISSVTRAELAMDY
jgi:hypothetical protein